MTKDAFTFNDSSGQAGATPDAQASGEAVLAGLLVETFGRDAQSCGITQGEADYLAARWIGRLGQGDSAEA